MARYVALLRGINVGGKTMIAMEELKKLFAAEGFDGARTLLQSGNVIFEAAVKDLAALEAKLEKAVAKKVGRTVDFFIRDAEGIEQVIVKNPYSKQAKHDPSHMMVLFLKSAPGAAAQAALEAAITGPEYFKAGERCLYMVYPEGMGRSKLTSALIDRKLGISGTARNWNTVMKIAGLLSTT